MLLAVLATGLAAAFASISEGKTGFEHRAQVDIADATAPANVDPLGQQAIGPGGAVVALEDGGGFGDAAIAGSAEPSILCPAGGCRVMAAWACEISRSGSACRARAPPEMA